MINKTDLHSIIHKYFLNGKVETVKWSIKDKVLSIEFMDLGGSFIGNLKYEEIDLPNVEVGFGSTSRFLKLLAILNGELYIDFISQGGIIEKMTLDDSKFNIKYALYALEGVPKVATLDEYPEIDVEISLTTEDIESLLKANHAISENNEFSIKIDKNLDGEDMVNFIFGENSPHSNKVTYGVRGNVINNFDVDFRFDSELLKEILGANKKCLEGIIKFSTKGLLHYIFKEEGCSTDYYTTRKV